ncbi:hypothetical protein [Spiroplasma endosymbiont of Labia minor]|uniref:hypothetical protein n=1 Tax=Spiroplasma endosymbiont of Labia minor TaxID=3066305 RepID=UPI0030D4AC7E
MIITKLHQLIDTDLLFSTLFFSEIAKFKKAKNKIKGIDIFLIRKMYAIAKLNMKTKIYIEFKKISKWIYYGHYVNLSRMICDMNIRLDFYNELINFYKKEIVMLNYKVDDFSFAKPGQIFSTIFKPLFFKLLGYLINSMINNLKNCNLSDKSLQIIERFEWYIKVITNKLDFQFAIKDLWKLKHELNETIFIYTNLEIESFDDQRYNFLQIVYKYKLIFGSLENILNIFYIQLGELYLCYIESKNKFKDTRQLELPKKISYKFNSRFIERIEMDDDYQIKNSINTSEEHLLYSLDINKYQYSPIKRFFTNSFRKLKTDRRDNQKGNVINNEKR